VSREGSGRSRPFSGPVARTDPLRKKKEEKGKTRAARL